MGSGKSGLYSGTVGSGAAHVVAAGISPETARAILIAVKSSKPVMTQKVKDWAQKEVDTLEAVSRGKRKKFNTASIVYDEESDQYFYGRNNGIELSGAEKNPELFGENGILPKKPLNDYPFGNCAEVDAINSALNAGAKLKNLTLTTIHASNKGFGEPKKACKNCTYTFKGKIKHNHTGWEEL